MLIKMAGNSHSLPIATLAKSPLQSRNLKVDNVWWINQFGRASVTILSELESLTFQIQGRLKETYSIYYTQGVGAFTSDTDKLAVKTKIDSWNGSTTITIIQKKEYTPSGVVSLSWEFLVTSTSSTNTVLISIEPLITVMNSST